MAEETPQDDKTEEPTARRLEKAREDGQVLRSQDLTIAVVTTGFLVSIYLLGFYLGPALLELYEASLIISAVPLGEPDNLITRFAGFASEACLTLLPVFGLAIFFAIGGATSLDGFVLSGKALDNLRDSQLDELVVTDSIPLSDEARALSNIRQLTISDLLAESIRRVSNEESISALFDE